MASIAETQELVARLRLDTSQFTQSLAAVQANIRRVEAQLAAIPKGVGGRAFAQVSRENAASLAAYEAARTRFYALEDAATAKTTAAEKAAFEARGALADQYAAQRIQAANAWAAADVRATEQSAAAAQTAMTERLASIKALEAEQARWDAQQAASGAKALTMRRELAQAAQATKLGAIDATAAMNARLLEQQAAAAEKLSKTLRRVGGVAREVAAGGFKFLERTTLAAAAAGGVLELGFIKVQEAQAAFARTLTGESDAAIAKATSDIMELSKVVPVAVTELYRIGEVIGTTNVAADSVAQLTEVVAKLASTTDLTADEAAISIARLLNMFGQIDDKGHIAAGAANDLADAIFRSSLRFASSDQEIIRASLRFGALANMMHMTQGQVIALSGAVTGLGQEPEAVGGSFQRLFQIINKAVGEADKLGKVTPELKTMADLAKMTPEAFGAGIKNQPFETFIKLVEGFSKLSPTEQSVLFGKGGIFPSFVRGAQTLQNLGLSYEEVLQASKEFDKNSGQFDKAFATRIDTIAKKFQLLINAVTRGATVFGAAFAEEMGGAIEKVTQWITDNEAAFEEWGRKVATAIKSIDWNQLKGYVGAFFNIFKTGLEATKGILDILGPQMTALLVGLKTVNSLSGGAIGSLGGGLLSGLGGLVAKALAVALRDTGVGKFFVQPVFVTNPGFGLGSLGGGPSKLPGGGPLALLGKVFVVGIALEALNELTNLIVPKVNEFLGTRFKPGIDPITTLQNFGEVIRNLQLVSQTVADRVLEIFGHRTPRSPIDTGGFPFGSDLAAKNAGHYMALIADYGRTEADLAKQIADNTGGTEQGIAALTRKLIEALKPRHRAGEVGKSIQSAEFAALSKLRPNDPQFADKLNAYVSDLIDHYTKQPIGTKGHARGFILPPLNREENRLGRELRQALRDGNYDLATTLARSLKGIGGIPGNDLPAWIRRLIRQAEKGHAETKAAIDAEKRKLAGGIETSNERIAFLRQTLARKKLSARVVVHPPRVKTGNVYVTPRVFATIGQRTVVRSGRTSVAYGPTYTGNGSGTFSLYGDEYR